MAYISLLDFASYVGSEIAVDEPFLTRCLATAEDAVNAFCGRSFDPPTASSITRNYVPLGDVVITDDFVDITNLAVTNNGSAVAATLYQLEPLNNLSASGLAVPYNTIRMTRSLWQTEGARTTVAVTSTRWGWPAVPPQVVEATAILAKDLAHVRTNRFGTAGFGEFGVIRVRDNPHVRMLLTPLVHPAGVGIG